MLNAPDAAFLRRILIVVGVGAACLLVWRLREVLLLLFGASIVALILRSLSEPIARRTRLGDILSLALVVVGFLLLLGLVGAFFGWRIQAQVSEAADLLPKAYQVFVARVRANPLGARVLADLDQLHVGSAFPALLQLPRYALLGLTAVGDLLLAMAGGVYLAAQPRLYRDGLLRFMPPSIRGRARAVLDEAGALLRKWLAAQAIAMVTVAALVGIGMWIIGAPAPGALALFAGLAEFVPIVGPVVSAIPALLLALLHGVDKAVWTLVLFVVVQHFEGDLLLPLLQRRIVLLPPVLTLFAIVVFGVIFGPLGVLLATPLTVVAVVLANRLYLREDPRPAADPEHHGPPDRPGDASPLA